MPSLKCQQGLCPRGPAYKAVKKFLKGGPDLVPTVCCRLSRLKHFTLFLQEVYLLLLLFSCYIVSDSPGTTVRISQARKVEWVAISFYRGSS